MASVYFYKFNINSKIYDVYENPALLNQILTDVYDSIKTDATVSEEYGDNNVVEYKFCDLIKNPETYLITGRLVKIYDGETQKYDRVNDTVETEFEDDKAASATFCFDVFNEEIAFITRLGLGYIQFGNMFKQLLDLSLPEEMFELVLEKNVGVLKQKVYSLKRVIKIETEMIPPNANENDFDNLLGASKEEYKETNATKFCQVMEVPAKKGNTLNSKSTFFKRVFYGVGKGYAKMKVLGFDDKNTLVPVNSDEHAPYTYPIPANEKDSLTAFTEYANAGIRKLKFDKSNIKFEDDNE